MRGFLLGLLFLLLGAPLCVTGSSVTMPQVTHDWAIGAEMSPFLGIREYNFPDLTNLVARGDVVVGDRVHRNFSTDCYSTVVALFGYSVVLPHRILSVVLFVIAAAILLFGMVGFSISVFRRDGGCTADAATNRVAGSG